jgi:23S rRNA pseudouridine1911/1915/1917 synthase
LKPFEFAVKIIYEDEDIIVVDKPTGLVVHPPQKGYQKTLVNALIYLKKKLYSPAGSLRPGVVHRLDKETSGVMVLAKNRHSYEGLVSQFKARRITKDYRAVVWGAPQKDKMLVDLPLSRDTKNRLKMKVSFLKAKAASTEITIVEALEGATYLRLRPRTGRMHQIRVHLKFLGLPIVGDKKYGVKDKYQELFLHAADLSFTHPGKPENLSFHSELPERFLNFFREHRLRN